MVVLAILVADGVVVELVVEVEAEMAKTSGEEMNHCSHDFC